MEQLTTTVCIVGAGPAGLVLAHLLRRSQIPCIVLERLSGEALRRRTRAGMIEYRTVQMLDAHGLAKPILLHGAPNGACEFRADDQAFVLDYAAITGGRGHHIYPQHELVGELAEMLLAEGVEIRYGTRVTDFDQDDDGATVSALAEPNGERLRIRCQAAAGCDGAGGPISAGIADAQFAEAHHPFRWLAVIADVPPANARTIYGLHRRGFAGQMRRGPATTRYYLEVPVTDTLDEWPPERIWAELEQRLHATGQPPLGHGQLLERDLFDLRVRVIAPMQDRRLFLAGDAAHLITPAGGKGMNLAIQDALELAAGLGEKYGHGADGTRLASYSTTRLAEIWRTQEFSNWMLALLHAGETSEFAYGLRRARLAQLIADPRLRSWFAHAYAGVDA